MNDISFRQCPESCSDSNGFQTRSLACVSRSGARVSRNFCPKEFRPIRKRRCAARACGLHSCADVQRQHASRTDGPYLLLVGGRNITIYCHLMNTSSPKEYLTLPSGHLNNYAEIYDKAYVNQSFRRFHNKNWSKDTLHNSYLSCSESSSWVTFLFISLSVADLSRRILARMMGRARTRASASTTVAPLESLTSTKFAST